MRGVTARGALSRVDGFRWHLQAKGLSVYTIRNYVKHAGYWVDWCNEHEIDYLTAPRDAVSIYLGHKAETAKQSTVMLHLLCIRYFYIYLIEEGLASENPALKVQYRRQESPLTNPVTDDEIRRMYNACANFREQAVFLLLAFGGLRRTEVFNVQRGNCDFENGSITILGKGRKYRQINPGPSVMGAVKLALQFDDRLCPFGGAWYVAQVVERLAKKAGVKGRIYPHRFRHTFATTFLEAGGQIDELMIILGHSRPEMSMFYARASQQRRALVRMQEIDLPRRMGLGA